MMVMMMKVVPADFLQVVVSFSGSLLIEHAASSVGTVQDVYAAQRLVLNAVSAAVFMWLVLVALHLPT